MSILEGLKNIGVDLDTVLQRFSNNEGLLERFMLKFPKDETYKKLEQAVATKNYTDVEKEAHTLKGTAANLGFDTLSKTAAQMVEKVRNQDYDDIEGLLTVLSEEYQKIISTIEGSPE